MPKNKRQGDDEEKRAATKKVRCSELLDLEKMDWESYAEREDLVRCSSVTAAVRHLSQLPPYKAYRGVDYLLSDDIFVRLQLSYGTRKCKEEKSQHLQITVQQIIVNPSKRRQGIATRFLKELVQKGAEMEPSRCVLVQSILNEECRQVVTKCGMDMQRPSDDSCYVQCVNKVVD